ncbi:hypothetical protein XBFM1_1260025 [Xenorhabdus bovienii str. feltiae Moldova]|uniref:Uncharacterized protein n=1 Tax=Xenorhabdus bovienii str. feltiae Moldova TaxID=1398200 RepID=A0A077NQA5_XENBV|nr:hypothetical protein XBFM1_1260025 [Xenorhabdus bovienii str. feltiae Moldova]
MEFISQVFLIVILVVNLFMLIFIYNFLQYIYLFITYLPIGDTT